MFMVNQLIGFGVGGGTLQVALPALTFNANSTGWKTFSIRQIIAANVMTISGLAMRFRLVPPTTGFNTNIVDMFVGHQAGSGDAYDMAAAGTRVTFSGLSTVTLTAGGASVLSDTIAFNFDRSRAFIMTFDFDNTPDCDIRRNIGLSSDYTHYYKVGSGEGATADVTGYANTGTETAACIVDQIEVAP